MKLLFVILIVATSVVVGNAIASRASHTDWNSQPEPYAFTYNGRLLYCVVTESGSEAAQIGGLSCDFVRYWRERK